MRETVVQSTEASEYLAKLIAEQLDCNIMPIERKTFGDAEKYLRIGSKNHNELMGLSSIFVGSTHSDEDFLELHRVGCGLASKGVKRRVFSIPFFGYSTMERADKPGEVVTAKTNARILSSIPNTGMGNAFIMMDLHVQGLVDYFEGDCLRSEVRAQPYLVKAIEQLGYEDFVFGTADIGRAKAVRKLANNFKMKKIVVVDKVRDGEQTEVEYVIGDVRGKKVIIYDDMIRGGGSAIKAAKAYIDAGATEVILVVTHLAFNDVDAIERIADSPYVKTVIGTNSHPMSQDDLVQLNPKFIIMDVSGAFVPCIRALLR